MARDSPSRCSLPTTKTSSVRGRASELQLFNRTRFKHSKHAFSVLSGHVHPVSALAMLFRPSGFHAMSSSNSGSYVIYNEESKQCTLERTTFPHHTFTPMPVSHIVGCGPSLSCVLLNKNFCTLSESAPLRFGPTLPATT
jgi:hypothetical protein